MDKLIKFGVNFGFIGSTVITMFHQVNYSEIVTIMLKPVGAVLENFENSQFFFSESVFSAQRARLRLSHKGFFCVLRVQFRKDYQFSYHIWSSIKA